MATELSTTPTCPVCGSTRVGTLAKQITKDTAWRCAECGETFKAKPSPQMSTAQRFVAAGPRRNRN
jgi:transposase-like protein